MTCSTPLAAMLIQPLIDQMRNKLTFYFNKQKNNTFKFIIDTNKLFGVIYFR